MVRVQILTVCRTNMWKIVIKNSIINWFSTSFIHIVTKFTKHRTGFNKFMAKMVNIGGTNWDVYLSKCLDILHNLILGDFFPHIIKFKLKSRCFFFLVKIMTSVLATLSFWSNQMKFFDLISLWNLVCM